MLYSVLNLTHSSQKKNEVWNCTGAEQEKQYVMASEVATVIQAHKSLDWAHAWNSLDCQGIIFWFLVWLRHAVV